MTPSRRLAVLALTCFSILAVPAAAVGAGEGQPSRPAWDAGAAAAWRASLDAALSADERAAAAREVLLELGRREGRVEVLLELDGSGDAPLKAAVLEGTGNAVVLGRTRLLLDAVGIEVDSAAVDLERLRALPGVARVHVLPRLRLLTSTSVPFIGAPAAWELLGAAGEGTRIGVIDSGVDYLHPHFGGSGNPADYAARELAPAAFFPTDKVKGWDFYDDDFDPFDCRGHGTHVAGIAAGYGVRADGTAYTGPWDATLPFDTFEIGPGAAPAAEIHALRVGGCEGEISAVAVLEALEYAVDPDGDGDTSDHLDVVNLSLGSDFGHPDDPLSRAVDAAVDAGVGVVSAAGNSHDVHFVVSTPSSARKGLSVAATVDDGLPGGRLTVHEPASVAGDYEVRPSDNLGPALTAAGFTAELATDLEPADGCVPLSNPASAAGRIALIDRGGCAFTVKTMNAQDAGAAAVLIVNRDDELALIGGFEADPLFDQIEIPVAIIGRTRGTLLRGAPSPRATLASGPLTALADMLLDRTSRGPVPGLLKPDLSAPGRAIASSVPPFSVVETRTSGTSMAAPHVAGVLALLRQLHPDWSLAELKALLMNTATDVYTEQYQGGAKYSPARVGAGRLQAAKAFATTSVAYAAGDPDGVSLSFETVEVVGQVSETRRVRVVNHGRREVTWAAEYRATSDAAGVDVVPGAGVTVPAGGVREITVTLEADSGAMTLQADPTLDLEPLFGRARFVLAEESGHLLLHGDDGTELRLPVYAAARPASSAFSARRLLFGREVKVRGTGFDTTDVLPLPAGAVPVLSGYELQHVSPDEPGTEGLFASQDLAYVGVASDYRSVVALDGGLADASVYFGIATHGNWATPREVAFEVEIDLDRDREAEYLLTMHDLGTLTQSGVGDVFINFLVDTSNGDIVFTGPPNGYSPAELHTALYNNNVVQLSTPLEALLGEAAEAFRSPAAKHEDDGHDHGEEEEEERFTFDYRVRVRNRAFDVYTDVTPWLTYSPTHPGVDFSDADGATGLCPCLGPPTWFDVPGTDVPMRVLRENLRANGSLGALLLHHHNDRAGNRAEAVLNARWLDVGDHKAMADPEDGGWTYFILDLEDEPGTLTVALTAEGHDDGEDDGEDDGHEHGRVPATKEGEDDGHDHGEDDEHDHATGHGNPDLYVRYGAPPTRSDYDERSTNVGPEDAVTLVHPKPGRYYVGVLAVQAYEEVEISAEEGEHHHD